MLLFPQDNNSINMRCNQTATISECPCLTAEQYPCNDCVAILQIQTALLGRMLADVKKMRDPHLNGGHFALKEAKEHTCDVESLLHKGAELRYTNVTSDPTFARRRWLSPIWMICRRSASNDAAWNRREAIFFENLLLMSRCNHLSCTTRLEAECSFELEDARRALSAEA
jgi:hypothetical protein